MITQKKLKKNVNYCPLTGIFMSKKGKILGHNSSHGYIRVSVLGKIYYAHRLAWLYTQGSMPEQIDHVNHNKQDNRISNLRDVSHNENHKNMSLYKNNVSGVHGVTFCKNRNKWVAGLTFNGKRYSLGRYNTMEEAIEARLAKELDVGFYSNHGKD